MLHKTPVAVSPDRRTVAFAMRRGDPERNRICMGIYVLSLAPGSTPRLLDVGGLPLSAAIAMVGLYPFPNGGMQTVQPRWSPDGQTLAFLKRTGQRTRIWGVRIDGGAARMLVSLAIDIDDFAWSPDGTKMRVTSTPDVQAAQQAIDQEADHGYLYDMRAFPMGSVRPLPRVAATPRFETVDLATGKKWLATDSERSWGQARREDIPADGYAIAIGPRRDIAWQAQQGVRNFGRSTLTAKIGRRTFQCSDPACEGKLDGPWWSADRRSLVFARHGIEEAGLTRFYRWEPQRHVVRLLRDEDARYVGCRPAGGRFICLREDPSTPFQIVSFVPGTGRYQLLFDPNPEISGQFHGSITRLVWRDEGGTQAFGHLTLPPDYRPGQRLPLVVVQYRAAGFQRGGVGDEAPILPMANDGFAVLNFERPDMPGSYSNIAAHMRLAMSDWYEERRALAALEAGVHLLIDRGIVDRGRIGLWGLSAGSQTGQFALIHSRLFKAMSLATCCKDPYAIMVEAGPAYRQMQEDWGLAPVEAGNIAHWKDVSPAMNASTIETPLLLQLPEWEFREALGTVAAFGALKRPIELDVFPGEYHVKMQPAHRLAIYQRNIDWFDYWLRDKENDAPDKAAQYARWDQLRDHARARTP